MAEKKVKKNNWFKQFMIFLLVIVVAVSLGLIIFYFTQDGERISKNQTKVQVNAKNAFSVELTQSKYKSSTKIEAEFDSKALSIPADGITSRIEGKNKITTYKFVANAEDGSYVAGDYNIVFKTTAKDKASRELSVEVVIADGVSKAFFVGDAEQLKNIGSSDLYASDKNYELTQDIDLKTLDEGEGRTSWAPLANFSGTLNGNGHKISNLYINADDEQVAVNDIGFFAVLNSNAKVYNVTFEDAQIISTSDKTVNAGIVAGQSSGTIERVALSTTKDGVTKVEVGKYEAAASASDVEQPEAQPTYSLNSKVNVGAIAGVLKRSNNAFALIDRVAVPAKVQVLVASNAEDDSYVGGIAGLVQNGTIYNSYVQGIVDVKGAKVFAGGIAGKMETRADLIQNTLAVTTNKKANIINSYTTAKVSTNQAENVTIGAVIAKNENLGLLNTIDTNTLQRTYVQDVADARSEVQSAVNTLTDQNFKTSISNKVADAQFVVSGEDKLFNVINENRFVGVYYKYANGDVNLTWYPGVASNIAQDVKLAETTTEGATVYDLVTSTMSGSQNDYNTYNYLKNKQTWDFKNVWIMGANGLPELRMTEFATSFDVYDPQSAEDGNINSIDRLQAIDGKEGNFKLVGNDPENDKIFRIKAEDNYTPIALNGNLYGNGVTVVIEYDSNKDFAGLFSTIAAKCEVRDLNVQAVVNTIGKSVNVGSNKGFGIIAQENYGTIENVVVYDTTISLSNTTTNSKAIAAVAGYNEGTIKNVRTENVKITLDGAFNGVSVGFIVGKSDKGLIQEVESFGAGSEIVSTDKNAVITAGMVAGELSGQAELRTAKAVGRISLATDGTNYVGGIVGKTESTGIITAVLVENAILRANIVGGIAGLIQSSDANGNSTETVTVAQVNKTVTLEGSNVGGFVGVMENGILRNSATYATLKGVNENSTISGFAYQINGSTGGSGDIATCAQMYDVFASVVLDTSATQRAYKETTSEIRKTNDNIAVDWWRNTQLYDDETNPTKHKVAGYIADCYFNSDLMGFARAQTPSKAGNSTERGLSETACKDANNFSSTFRNPTLWFFETEQMPVLTVFTTDDFNGVFKTIEEAIAEEAVATDVE